MFISVNTAVSQLQMVVVVQTCLLLLLLLSSSLWSMGGSGGGGAQTWRILFQTIFVNSVHNKEIYNIFSLPVSKWLTDFWTALYTQL